MKVAFFSSGSYEESRHFDGSSILNDLWKSPLSLHSGFVETTFISLLRNISALSQFAPSEWFLEAYVQGCEQNLSKKK